MIISKISFGKEEEDIYKLLSGLYLKLMKIGIDKGVWASKALHMTRSNH